MKRESVNKLRELGRMTMIRWILVNYSYKSQRKFRL